jgi:hypothetical protein
MLVAWQLGKDGTPLLVKLCQWRGITVNYVLSGINATVGKDF